MSTIIVETLTPLSGSEAARLAATEYQRLVDQLRALDPGDWARPTDCPAWDVRAMAGHCVGMLSDFSSLRAMMRRMLTTTKESKTTGALFIDAMTSLQVAEYASLSQADLIARAAERGPVAARWRARTPASLRRMSSKNEVGGQSERWRMGYLFDTILTRDPWMHRVDITRATGRDMVLTAGHDGRLVADVVAEWARRHGRPFRLTLTGPAGGEFASREAEGETITLDAVEFCRVLSGRAPGESGLLAREVPF